MPDPRISEDTILLVARLINESEDMKNAANDALKDTWADHRETLKSLGLSGKEISAEVAQFKAAIAENRLTATEADKRDQKAEGKDEYLAILTSSRARARERQSNTTQNTSNSGSDDEENEPESTTPQKRIAALRADPAMAIVEAVDLKPEIKPQPTKAAGQVREDAASAIDDVSDRLVSSLPGAERTEDRETITEPQPSQPAGSDLTSLAPHEGQVAPIQPETATETPSDENSAEGREVVSHASLQDQPETADDDRSCVSVLGGLAPSLQQQATREGEAARPLPPTYAEPGVVVWEHTPPEPVRRHPYSAAFGDLGQDLVVIDDDIAGAKSEPIVRIGNEILDGWARYNVARGMIGGSGMSTEYPVMQYAGTDPLLDCIRWNISGRILSDKDKQTIVARLSAIEPKRKADILKAVAELAI